MGLTSRRFGESADTKLKAHTIGGSEDRLDTAMAKNAMGWNRADLEALQAVDRSPGSMLHPAHLPDDHQQHNQQYHQQYTQQQYDQQHYNQQHNYQYHHPQQQNPVPVNSGGDGRPQDWLDSSISGQSGKILSPVTPVPEARPGSRTPGLEARILGLRRTTFFLTVSNILLAIGLVVLGVVQNHALKNSSGASTSTLEAQGSCPSSTPSGTSTSASPLPTCSPEAGKVCFATDNSITTAVALGEVINECPLPSGSDNYTVPGTNLKFKRVCETDYPNDDMGQFPVITMADCIHLCAQLNLYPASARGRCMGVSWVYADGPQGTGISFCYPKSAMGAPNDRAATESALLLDE